MTSAVRRADNLAEAMEARGYHNGPRTTLRVLRINGPDYAALASMAIFIALLAISGVYLD
jgi:energy-coupling factor transporter transmembrane protein EcfT